MTLIAVVVALGAVHLVADAVGWRIVAGLSKAVSVVVLAYAVGVGEARNGGGAGWIALGLVLSAVGDVSLIVPKGFLAGLSAFFVAHVCYTLAFAPGATLTVVSGIAAVLLAAASTAMLRYLWPHVRKLRAPVTVYVSALAIMSWCAIARAAAGVAPLGAAAGAGGAVCFLVSDGVLAVDRFARPFVGAHVVVMVTYYAAQVLIASSVR